jgi:hypothetical protein
VLQDKDFDLDPCKSSPESGATFVYSSISVASSDKKIINLHENRSPDTIGNTDERKVKLTALASI